jgi:hypothetical protein
LIRIIEEDIVMARDMEREKVTTVGKAQADDASRYWLNEGWAPGGYVREVNYEANARGIDPLFEGIKIVPLLNFEWVAGVMEAVYLAD